MLCAFRETRSRETIEFEKSAQLDKLIELKAHRPETKRRCQKNGVPPTALKLRLIKVKLDSGAEELLITSLVDKRQYPKRLFKDLYHLRWGIEEDYKLKKVWAEYENFSGKSAISVLQDLHAKNYTQNIAAVIAFAAKPIKNNKRKHQYQINRAQTLSKLKNNIYGLTKRCSMKLIFKLIEIFSKTLEPIRLGRKEARPHRFRKRSFYPQYKTIR